MTIEMEDRLVSEIQEIEKQKRVLIRAIATANASGNANEGAAKKMKTLNRRKLRLTRPSASVAA